MRRVALLVVALSGVAAAQPAPAPAPIDPHVRAKAINAEALKQAQAAEAAGDTAGMEAAVAQWKRAIALDDQPVYECNLAYALEWLEERARAHARYLRCAPRLASAQPQQAARRLAAIGGLEEILVATHARVRIDQNGGRATATVSAFPPDELVELPTTVWLPPGKHTVELDWGDGRTLRATIDVAADELGRERRVHLDAPPPPAPPPFVAPEGRDDGDPPPGLRVDGPAPSRRGAVVALAAGGALVAGGAVVHVLSRDPRAHLATLSGAAYDDYLPTWRKYQVGTIALYGAGTIALGVGAYLYLRTGSPVAIAPAPGGDGAVVTWTVGR